MKETIEEKIFADFIFRICPKISKLNSVQFFKEESITKTNFAKKIPFQQIVNIDYRTQTKLQELFYLFCFFLVLVGPSYFECMLILK